MKHCPHCHRHACRGEVCSTVLFIGAGSALVMQRTQARRMQMTAFMLVNGGNVLKDKFLITTMFKYVLYAFWFPLTLQHEPRNEISGTSRS
jgi:hypothetical protein